MKLQELSIENFRSIKSIKDAQISPLQILLGENNAGKSNILDAIDAFLSAGSGGVNENDFQDKSKTIIITAKFVVSSQHLKKIWKRYMINNELILAKHIWIEEDPKTRRNTIKNEFHGYIAEPKQWFLALKKITEKFDRPKWKDIVKGNNLPEYFMKNDSCTKDDFSKGLERYLQENDVEYDEPDLSHTQALGFQSKAVSNLPKFHLLKAETNYSDETDKRSSTSTFRRLMSDLTDRIIKNDPRYSRIEETLKTLNDLLNDKQTQDSQQEERLVSLSLIENRIGELLSGLMPSIENVKLKVVTEEVSEIFCQGAEIIIDDGVETDVFHKGHGLQRCIVFALLHALILNERNQLVITEDSEELNRPIILAIEEPELYLHPQLCRLFYDVLNSFAEKDQVIYSTHSPFFIDISKYESIALITKDNVDGTKFINCDLAAFNGLKDRDLYHKLTQLDTNVNELFFAKKVIVVEGSEDKIAIIETAKKLGKIKMRTEEIDVTIIVAGGKTAIPFFARILNAFKFKYAVLHDLDICNNMNVNDQQTHAKINKDISDLASGKIVTFPVKLEDTLGLQKGHFKDQYEALIYFTDHSNINTGLENYVKQIFSLVGITI